MACCTSLPYFVTADRELFAVISETDDLLMYDSEDDENVLRKCLTLLNDPASLSAETPDADDKLLPVSASPRDESCETFAGGPLLNDCMWSAGMLPPDLKAAAPPTRRSGDCLALTAAEDADVDADAMCPAVDPSLISPCPHVSHQPVTSSPVSGHVTLTPPCTDPGIHVVTYLVDYSRHVTLAYFKFLQCSDIVGVGPVH